MSAKRKLHEDKGKSGSRGELGTVTLSEAGSGNAAKRGKIPLIRTPNDRARKRIWTTEEQPGLPAILLRGIEKVTLEVGWLSLAHNLLKQAANDQKRGAAILH